MSVDRHYFWMGQVVVCTLGGPGPLPSYCVTVQKAVARITMDDCTRNMYRLHRLQTTSTELLVGFWGRGMRLSLDAVFGLAVAADLFDTVHRGQPTHVVNQMVWGSNHLVCTVSMWTPGCETDAADTLMSESSNELYLLV